MEKKCPKCGISLRPHSELNQYSCCIHGDFKLNFNTGEMEPLKKEEEEDGIFFLEKKEKE